MRVPPHGRAALPARGAPGARGGRRAALPLRSPHNAQAPTTCTLRVCAQIARNLGGCIAGRTPLTLAPAPRSCTVQAAYDVRRAVAAAQAAGVVAAEAHLQERLEDLGEAGRLYLKGVAE